jgi:hypothetical protein
MTPNMTLNLTPKGLRLKAQGRAAHPGRAIKRIESTSKGLHRKEIAISNLNQGHWPMRASSAADVRVYGYRLPESRGWLSPVRTNETHLGASIS